MKNLNLFYKGKFSKKSNSTNLKMLKYSGFFDIKKTEFSVPPNIAKIFNINLEYYLYCFSRYKFVSRLLKNKKNVAEYGSSEGFCSPIISKNVKKLTLIDNFFPFVEEGKKFIKKYKNIKFLFKDFYELNSKNKFDAIYSLDTLEHLDKKKDNLFFKSIINNLSSNGVCIIGIPTREYQRYTNKINKIGHINCKSEKELRKLCDRFFHNTFIFTMNDEIISTGFSKMATYIFSISTGKK